MFFLSKLAMQMSAVAETQVKAEKERLVESRLIAESEKRLYVKVYMLLLKGKYVCVPDLTI